MMVLGSLVGEQGGCGFQELLLVVVIHETLGTWPYFNSLMSINC
jgi:hypothetical protein